MIYYNGKIFRSVSNSENGEVTAETFFHYKEENDIVTAEYSGGNILAGHLIALRNEQGVLDMRYHHINTNGQLMTGICEAIPEILPNGKLRLFEKWKWTSGDESEGESVVEEV
jgi:hypothetical protein